MKFTNKVINLWIFKLNWITFRFNWRSFKGKTKAFILINNIIFTFVCANKKFVQIFTVVSKKVSIEMIYLLLQIILIYICFLHHFRYDYFISTTFIHFYRFFAICLFEKNYFTPRIFTWISICMFYGLHVS